MDIPQTVLATYLVAINVATFVAFAVDKRRARTHRWRISEATLLGLSAAGGALGGIVAMRLCHHKTRKPRFSVGLPSLLGLQAVLLAWAHGRGLL